MESKDLPTREAAFDEVMGLISEGMNQGTPPGDSDPLARFSKQHPDQAERVKLGLIHLLSADNDLFMDENTAPGTYTEDDSEHYAELIDTVSRLNDERAIPALVGAITTGGMAQRGLMKYGDKALGPVLERLKNPNALVRAAALGVSVALLEARNEPDAHVRAKALIRASMGDADPVVRGHAVREIECLDGREDFIPAVEQLARTDPAKLPGKALDGGDGEEFYPVRFDARRVLKAINSHEVCRGR